MEIVVSLPYREAMAIPLQYFPSVTTWDLQGVPKRARMFRENEGAAGRAETPHLKNLGRDPGSGRVGKKYLRVDAT